ncbi:MAG: ABC transporter ATP-binding protein [Candidatus Gracilibacteria bacterium]
MSFIQTTKKFFEPVRLMPKIHLQNMFEGFYSFVYSVFSIEILKLILKSIEFKETEKFWNLIYIYFIITLLFSGGRFLMYKWGRTQIMFEGCKVYYEKYLNKYVQAEGNDVEKIGTGRFVSILRSGLHDWLDMLFQLGQKGFYGILFLFYAIYTIFNINIAGGLISLLLIFIGGIISYYANVYMKEKRLLRKIAEREADHQAVIALMSKNELMQNNSLKTILSKIAHNYEMSKVYQYPVNIGFTVVDELPRVLFLFIRIGVYIFLSNLILKTNSSFSDLAIFITIISMTELSMNNFLDIVRMILRDFASVQLLWETFENLTPIKGFDIGNDYKTKTDKIVINNISYGYTDKKIFDKFSLEINGLQKTALVGVSGGGKTTLMKIIAGYLRPKSGIVDIFGNDLKKTSLKSYFANIGYLTQEPSVFDGTIRENLQASVREETNEAEMIKSLKDAECEFVFEFEKGIDTEIGEKGIRLSGGQRQRLAIAKVFIKNPEIILLDEPTSALDSFSEEKITKAMHRLFKGRTVIVIAHRLQTVKEADDIILIEDGKVVERGTHRELVAKKGIYKNMLDLQSGF